MVSPYPSVVSESNVVYTTTVPRDTTELSKTVDPCESTVKPDTVKVFHTL